MIHNDMIFVNIKAVLINIFPFENPPLYPFLKGKNCSPFFLPARSMAGEKREDGRDLKGV